MTPVLFRVDKDGPHRGDLTAVFPTMPADSKGNLTCYATIGQHSACSPDWMKRTRPASKEEYAPLLAELQRIGYDDLQVYDRLAIKMERAG